MYAMYRPSISYALKVPRIPTVKYIRYTIISKSLGTFTMLNINNYLVKRLVMSQVISSSVKHRMGKQERNK